MRARLVAVGKAGGNVAFRSWMRKRQGQSASCNSQLTVRACCATQAARSFPHELAVTAYLLAAMHLPCDTAILALASRQTNTWSGTHASKTECRGMALTDLWDGSRAQLDDTHTQQSIAFAGAGKPRDGQQTSVE